MRNKDQQLPIRHSKSENAILIGLFASVVFTAIAHGAVEAWSVAVFELLIVGLTALWVSKMVARNRIAIRLPATALPLMGLLMLGLVQSIAFTDGIGQRISLSLDVEATRTTVLALFFLVLSFVISVNVLETPERKQRLVTFLIMFGLLLALFALLQHFTWNGRLYWFRSLTKEAASPFGPFVNRNHFAGYMEMLAPIPIAMLITGAAHRDSRLFYLFAAFLMSVAGIASLSRGGMISLAAEFAFLAIIGAGNANRNQSQVTGLNSQSTMFTRLQPAALILIIIGSLSAGIFWVGPERIVDRIAGRPATSQHQPETFFSSRGWIWRETIAMIAANPFGGVGLGAYETAYPIYSKDDGSIVLGKSLTVDRAHNDYLQLLADCGVVGGALAVWFITAVFLALARGRRSQQPLCRALAIGGGAGIFGLLVHSLVDFNLQLPSNALLFLLLSAAVSQAGMSERSGEDPITSQRADRNRVPVGA